MLHLLHIENIAVIEEADIRFEEGFNVLTGETGAGKSIVIDALGAVLGQRTSRDLLRTGAAKAYVSAAFSGVPAALMSDCGAEGDELVLERELTPDGKNACRINGRMASVMQLKELGKRLLDIHGQHEGQQLLDEQQHLSYLDRFGQTEKLIELYTDKYNTLTEIRRKSKTLQMDEAERSRRVDTLQFQIGELERADLKEGEEEELSARREILRNSEKFSSAIAGADQALWGDDEGLGAVSALKTAAEELRGLQRYGDRFAALAARIESLRAEAEDVSESLRDVKREYEFSPEELDAVEERCDKLYRLKKKYGADVGEMLAYLAKCREELDNISFADDTLARLAQEEIKAKNAVLTAAKELSDARKTAAKDLSARILAELRALDMPKVQFTVAFEEKEPDLSGTDAVRFLMSANVGETMKPIDRIASGGELARIMLALKNVLAEQDEVATLVFDEVDTGVSGRAAEKVAEKLFKVSCRKQVLCVTHLPQIAAMAEAHLTVEKGERNGRTYTAVQRLETAERAKELARLTAGTHITESQLASNTELLNAAEVRKAALRAEA